MTSSIKHHWRTWACLLALLVGSLGAAAQDTNRPAPRIQATNQPASQAQEAARPGTVDYSAFKLIADRNIFNANRYAGMANQRRIQVDTASLVGTMTYGKGNIAFFEGNSSEFTKTLKPEESIAGYKVSAVAASGVKLEAGTNKLELQVGYQLRREDGGPWAVAMITGAPSGSDGASGSGRDSGGGDRAGQNPGFGRARNQDSGSGQGGFNVQVRQSRRYSSDSQFNGNSNSGSGSTSSTVSSGTSGGSSASPSEVLQRLMQRREQESK